LKTGQNLKILVCGKQRNLGDISSILSHLGDLIVFFGNKSCRYVVRSLQADITEFGPFVGRRLLESACTALLSRIDPYRLLLVKRYQTEPHYNIGARGKLSIQWTTDVMGTKPAADLWEQKLDAKDVSRGLFSAYSDQLFWTKACVLMQDTLTAKSTLWLDELKAIPPEGATNFFRTEADRLFSSLSKGVHAEFVVPSDVVYDSDTVIALLQDTISLLCKISIAANFIETSPIKTSANDLVKRVESIENEVIDA